MEIMTRSAARSNGLSHYCTGKPCKRGHIALRRVSDTNCMECERVRLRTEYNDPNERSRRLDACKVWAKDNQDYVRDYLAKWQKEHAGLVAAYSAKYRSKIMERTPPWADLGSIKAFYEKCPQGYHVDHIVPLQGRTVSGLHVLNNLQYLTARENLSKGNRYVESS